MWILITQLFFVFQMMMKTIRTLWSKSSNVLLKMKVRVGLNHTNSRELVSVILLCSTVG